MESMTSGINRAWVHLSAAVLIARIVVPEIAFGATIEAGPSNYRTVLASLNPGDTMMLSAGTYTGGLPVDDVSGTAAQPIIIRGPDDQSAIFRANDCCNTVQLENASFIEIRNLTLDGTGTNGAFGVDSRGNCHDVTIENLRIINYGSNQQVVGISTKGPAWNWVIRRNAIIRAGTGIYLGNSDGSAPFVNGTVENNLIIDTIGYNMQIKHQLARPTGIGLPAGQSRTIIRNNVFSKQDGTVGSDGARPNLLVGHFPVAGAGATDRYEIYGNFFYQNPTEALFQGEGNLLLHDNVFVNSAGSAVNITAQNDKPRAVTVYHNTVVASGSGIRVSNADPAYVQSIVGNAVFAGSPVAGPNQQGNVAASYAAAADYLVAPTAAIGSLDLYPKTGRLSGPATDLAKFDGFVDGTLDFNGRSRTGVFRGAYEGEGTNPGWRLALTIKPPQGGVPAPAITLTADPLTVPLQGSSTLTWDTSNADSCTASGGWSGAKPLAGSEAAGPLAKSTSFALTCTGPAGSTTQSVTVATADSTPVASVDLSASPSSVAAGESTVLAWQSTNSTSCIASGGWGGARAATGTETVGPIQAATTFTLTCTGPGGSGADTVAVGVSVAPTLSFQVDRTTVPAGESATLTWNAADATSCSASDAWSGNKATSGSQATGAVNATSTFTLTCSGAGGAITRQVTVAVATTGGPEPPAAGGRTAGGGSLSPYVLLGLLVLARRRLTATRCS